MFKKFSTFLDHVTFFSQKRRQLEGVWLVRFRENFSAPVKSAVFRHLNQALQHSFNIPVIGEEESDHRL